MGMMLTALCAIVLHAKILPQVWKIYDLTLVVLGETTGKGQRIVICANAPSLIVPTSTIVGRDGTGRSIVWVAVEGQFDVAGG